MSSNKFQIENRKDKILFYSLLLSKSFKAKGPPLNQRSIITKQYMRGLSQTLRCGTYLYNTYEDVKFRILDNYR